MPSILFIASNRIGDAVLSTGALDFALRRHPGAALDLACGPLPAPLFRATPGLRRLITIEKRRGDRHWLRLWRDLAGQRYDLAVDLRGTLITYALRARARIVHRKSAQLRHKIEELTATMGAASILAPKLTLDVKARADATAAVAEGPILALGPGANFIGKRWAPERFAALARRLAGPAGPLAGARVALLGGPEDARANAEIAASLTTDAIPALDLAGQLDLLACAALLERATLFVGNDSGLMHIAAASGAPTLGLFGPSDERVYGPWGPRARALRGRTYAEIMAIGYMPSIDRSLMDDVTVDAAEDAARELLQAGGLS
ncbi:MAG: glycosyltransferase family 9 protein [Hyphomonadaceae bacterium]|nr:glycosyltransferase family 9 protein [Hyphomonadaceae bacterium]